MLSGFSVKKPYTVVCGIIIVLLLGVISFTHMTTDLLPSMNFPYVIVYTPYVGATPEQVETEVTRPMESSFATLTDIKEITSTSSDNLSLVVLQFNDTVDMNTALIEINSDITTLTSGWSDSIGSPSIMKINPDMLPVSIISVSKDDMDIIALSDYVQDTLIPEYEAINGVAQVSASGLVTQEVDITIEQSLIDVLNSAILREVDEELADVEQQLIDAQTQISDGKKMLDRQRSSVMGKISDGIAAMDDFEKNQPEMVAGLTAQAQGLQKQLDEVNAAIAEMEPLVNMTEEERAQLQTLETQLAQLRAQKEQIEAQLAAIGEGSTEQIEDAKKQRAELVASRDACEALIASLSSADAATLREEISALDTQVSDAQSQLTQADAKLADATAAQEATQKRIEELKKQIAAMEGQPTQPPTEGPTEKPTDTPAQETTETPTEASTEAATEKPTEASAEGTTAESTETPTKEAPAVTTEEPVQTSTAEPAKPTETPAEGGDLSAFVWGRTAYAEDLTLEQLRNALAASEAAYEQESAATQAAQTERDNAAKKLRALEEERATKQKALEALRDGTSDTQIAAATTEINRLNSRISALDEEIAKLESGAGTEEGAALQSALDTVNAAIAGIEASDAYKALQSTQSGALDEQYAQAVAGKAQLEAGIALLNTNIEKISQGIIPGGMVDGIAEDVTMKDARAKLVEAKSTASEAFAEASQQLEEASDTLAEKRKEFEDARKEALENAGLDDVITVQMVAQILGAQNFSMPAGYVYDVENNETLVRVGDKFVELKELRTTKLFELGMDSIDEVRLCDVAMVAITDDSEDSFTKFDGQDGILLSIEKQSTFSTTDVAKRVMSKTEALTMQDTSLHVVDLFNQGNYITIVVDSVLNNLVYGGILAMLVLLLFLMDWRPTLIVAFSIPISVVAAFVCMYFSGITLNVLSLSGLALGIGMLVDNSIVSIENIYRMRDEEGLPILRASMKGVNQVSGALISSTLTTVCVFLPIVFITGMAHDLFVDLGLAITYSLVASLLVAMTVVPSMSATLLRKPRKKKHGSGLFGLIRRFYTLLLRGSLHVKPLVVAVAIALLLYAVLQVPDMNITFMPKVDSTQMSASLAIDSEKELEPQQERALTLMNEIQQVDGVVSVGLSSGSGTMSLMKSNDGLTYYIIVDPQLGRHNTEIAKDISAKAEAMGMDLSVQSSTMDISMLTGEGISVDVYGNDLTTMQTIAADVADIASGIEGVCDVDNGLSESVPELKITVDKNRAVDKGLTVAQVFQFVAQKLAGKTKITEADIDGKTMDIYMIDDRNSDIRPDTIMDLEIEVTRGNTSEMVRIADVAEVEEVSSLTSISRQAQKRRVTVSFNAADGYSLNHISDAFEEQLARYNVPDGYTVSISGENETVLEIMKNLLFVLAIAIVLIFLIMVAQFQSFKSPFIVLFTIPLAFTGGLLALLLTHMALSVPALVGFLVLEGIVVNNGIVFVDTVNQLRIDGMAKREAIVRTGSLRLRPILMTALTTILGMATMALGTGMGAEMMQPMAVVVVGGLLYSTLMTLFIVPALYDIFNGKKMKAREIEIRKEEQVLKEGN